MSGYYIMKALEDAGRTAYQSTGRHGSTVFVKMIIARGHLSVLEHISVSACIVCDRGVSHEFVRHRIASYTQESTRFCNYTGERFGKQITVIMPHFLGGLKGHPKYRAWCEAMRVAEQQYFELIELGCSPQDARSVLPNSLRTEIVATLNLRAWLHFFALRRSKAAHPDMQVIANLLWKSFTVQLPVIFNDGKEETNEDTS